MQHKVQVELVDGGYNHRVGSIWVTPHQKFVGGRRIARYELSLPAQLSLHPRGTALPSLPMLTDIEGTVAAGSPEQTAGMLVFAKSGYPVRQYGHAHDFPLGATLVLTHDEVAALDAIRNPTDGSLGLALALRLRFDPCPPLFVSTSSVTAATLARGEAGYMIGEMSVPMFVNVRVNLKVPQVDWVDALRVMGYTDRLIVEIPVGAKGTELGAASATLTKAQQEHLQGRYRETVATLREGAERLVAHRTRRAPETSIDPTRDDKDKRIGAILEALRQFTHPAHHSEEATGRGGKKYDWFEYDRADAEFALQLFAAFLRLYDETSPR